MTTSIEWTDKTWNPIIGCSRVSKGCEHCYAERVAHRGLAESHRGLTVMGKRGPRWTGEVRFLPERLSEPLRWRRPRRVFVNSMSDLFHEGVSDEQIAAIFGVMAACPQHTFQVLTKRPERMRDFFRGPEVADVIAHEAASHGVTDTSGVIWDARGSNRHLYSSNPAKLSRRRPWVWPLPNVWIGVSVEDQPTADERIPLLLDTPAAVRWVSYEPALGPVDFGEYLEELTGDCGCFSCENGSPCDAGRAVLPGLDWIVVGGESGPGARPFDLAWARSTIEQARAAGVRAFFKQAGSRPVLDGESMRLRDRKGGDLLELPADLRVREWPDAA